MQLPEKDILSILAHGQGYTQSILLQLFAPKTATLLKGKDGEKSTLSVRFTVARAFEDDAAPEPLPEMMRSSQTAAKELCVHGNPRDGEGISCNLILVCGVHVMAVSAVFCLALCCTYPFLEHVCILYADVPVPCTVAYTQETGVDLHVDARTMIRLHTAVCTCMQANFMLELQNDDFIKRW